MGAFALAPGVVADSVRGVTVVPAGIARQHPRRNVDYDRPRVACVDGTGERRHAKVNQQRADP